MMLCRGLDSLSAVYNGLGYRPSIRGQAMLLFYEVPEIGFWLMVLFTNTDIYIV